MAINLSIIGLGKIGTSIGLALQDHPNEILRTGFDREEFVSKKALALKAFDHISSSIENCVSKADIVILALPVDEIRITIETITPLLKSEAVLIDTSPIKIAISDIIQKTFPKDAYFVSLYPTINPSYLHESEDSIDFAHKDLFQNSIIVITCSTHTNNEVIKLASDLTRYLGAQVLFADPYEVDGLLAGLEILPKVISAAYIHSLMNQPGWQESQKLASSTFYDLSKISTRTNEREIFGESALLNKENTIRTINNLIFSLETIRDFLLAGNHSEVHKWISESKEKYIDWLINRRSATWNNQFENDNIPSAGDFLKRLIGFNRKKDFRKNQ